MATRIRACGTGDLSDGQGRTVEVGDKEVALFNVGGRFYAIANTCPHRGGPLGEGMLKGSEVTCPWHAWTFDVTNGQFKLNAAVKVACYKTEVVGGDVMIEA